MLVNTTVQTDGGAAPASTLMVGGKVFSGVPTEQADGDLAALWLDTFRRLIIRGFDFGSEALLITDVNPAIHKTMLPRTMTQLTAPGNTEVIDVQTYNRVAMQITAASIDTDIDLAIYGSLNGTDYFPLAIESEAVANLTISGAVATIDTDGTYVVTSMPCAIKHAYGVFVAETGGTNATVDIIMRART